MNKRLQLLLVSALSIFSLVAEFTFLASTLYGFLLIFLTWIIVYMMIAYWNPARSVRRHIGIGVLTFIVGGILLSALIVVGWAIDNHGCLQQHALNPYIIGYCRSLAETLQQSENTFLGFFGFSAVVSAITFRLAAGALRRHRS